MIKRGEVPEGYKKCNEYIIPINWVYKKLGQLGEFKKGREVSMNNVSEHGLPAMMYGDIYVKYDTKFYDVDYKISEEIAVKSTKVSKGDLLFTCSGETAIEIGKSVVYLGLKDIYIGGDILALSIKDENSTFLAYQQNSYAMIKQKARLGQGNSVVHIYEKSIKVLDVLLPSVSSEQKEIVKTLEVYDIKMSKIKQLIKEKKKQKKWIAQNVLTGIKRLKGFSVEWKKEKLGKLFSERNETNVIESELLSITGSGIIPRSEIEGKDNSSEDKSKYKKIYVGDIGYNTMRMWQGVSAYSNYEGIVSPAYTILKPNDNTDAKFFSYLFKLPSTIFLFYRYSQGLVDDTRNLKYENFKKIKVNIPMDVEEQKAIAKILFQADKEIELLQQQLEQIKLEKKAMMQLLLTGIVRVNQKGGE